EFEALFEAAMRNIAVPTLLVRGKLSDVVTEEGVQEFLRQIPGAKMVDVGGAAHMVAGDQNDAFSQAVIEFLEGDIRPSLERRAPRAAPAGAPPPRPPGGGWRGSAPPKHRHGRVGPAGRYSPGGPPPPAPAKRRRMKRSQRPP